LSRQYLSVGRAERAAEIAERCLAEYPATYDCHYGRAEAHLRRNEVREALRHLARAVALRPERGVAHHKLGLALEYLGCIEEAKEQYRLAIKLQVLDAPQSLQRLESPGSGPQWPVKPGPATELCSRALP
jgi:Flp pilus assembly protein TadD